MVLWSIAVLVCLGVVMLLLPALLAHQRETSAVTSASASLAVYRDQWNEAERDLRAGLLAPEQVAQVQADIRQRVLEDAESGPQAAAAGPSRLLAAL